MREIITSPLAWFSAALASLSGLLGYLDPVISLVSTTSGTWFPALAVFGSTIAPAIPSIPTGIAEKVLLVGAVVYVIVLGDRFLDRLE